MDGTALHWIGHEDVVRSFTGMSLPLPADALFDPEYEMDVAARGKGEVEGTAGSYL